MKKVLVLILVIFLLFITPFVVLADEYTPGEDATFYAQVLDGSGSPVNNATVTLTLWDNAGNKELDSVSMTYITGSQGLYGYNYTVPSELGVYVAEVVSANPTGYGSGEIHVIEQVSVNASCSVNTTEIWGFNISGYNGTSSAGGIINDALGGNMINIITIGVLASIAGLFVALYIWKREIWVSLVAAGMWLCLGLFLMVEMSEAVNPLQITDIWMGLGWVCIGITIVCGVATFVWNPTLEERWEEEVGDYEEPYMVQYRRGEPTGRTRPLTTLEKRERDQRLATETTNPSKRKRPTKFSTTGQV